MARFIDQLKRGGFLWDDPVTIFAQDIWNMLEGTSYRDEQILGLHSVVPPFEQTFVEFQDIKKRQIGMELERFTVKEVLEEGKTKYGIDTEMARRELMRVGYDDTLHWTVVGRLYTERYDFPLFHIGYGIFKDGTIAPRPFDGSLFSIEVSPEAHLASTLARLDPATYLNERAGAVALAASVCCHTFAFCHTKNVELVEQTPSAKLSKKHKRKHGQPLSSYHVLRIRGTRRIYEKGHGGGVERRSHIVAGHFKTYTEENGGLGRSGATGTWWWNNSTRGNRSKGMVSKDYEIDMETTDEQSRIDETETGSGWENLHSV